jgi:hypothetical protein
MFIAIIIAGHLRGLNETHNYIKKIEIEKIDREKNYSFFAKIQHCTTFFS